MGPNERQNNVFMAVAIDTYDEPNGIHPHYKQIVGERLSVAAMNVAYGDSTFPSNGPEVLEASVIEGPILSLKYNEPITYDNTEISGFYYCCIDYERCDSNAGNWPEIGKDSVELDDTDVTAPKINIKLGDLVACEMEVPHVAYLWRETPIRGYLAAPIYGKG